MRQERKFGQLFFSLMNHRVYDLLLYRWITTHFWNCPTDCLLDNYVENVSETHLEVGAGTGYFLEKTLCSDFSRNLVLLDLNKTCLAGAARRLHSLQPGQNHHDIRKPIDDGVRFKSVGLNYVLHCIPGGFSDNDKIFKHLHAVLEEGGVLFGATLLDLGKKNTWYAGSFMKLLNAVGIFNNSDHQLEELRQVLESAFGRTEIRMIGNAAVFRAWKVKKHD